MQNVIFFPLHINNAPPPPPTHTHGCLQLVKQMKLRLHIHSLRDLMYTEVKRLSVPVTSSILKSMFEFSENSDLMDDKEQGTGFDMLIRFILKHQLHCSLIRHITKRHAFPYLGILILIINFMHAYAKKVFIPIKCSS